ncbi:MAG: ABC transporter substrate-binding protein [Anaerolineales bacterium]
MKPMKFPVLFLVALLAAACAAPTPQPTLPAPAVSVAQATATPIPPVTFPLTLVDGLGRTITLEAPAQRIISLAPSNTEILFALGANAQLVGRDDGSDFPEAALQVASIGDTFLELNAELIISLEPDLVLAAQITPIEQVTQLEQLGINVFWLANPVDFEGLYANLATVGQMVGREQEAAALAPSLQSRVAAVDEALAGVTDKPTVFYEIDASDPAAPWTTGTGTFLDLLITRAGGQNAAAALQGDYAQISIEELLVQDPDFILLGDALYGVTVESVGQRAGWSDLSAVRNGNVVPFDPNKATRPGPRLVDALEELARLLHPDLFN